jgi:hypothetical protein
MLSSKPHTLWRAPLDECVAEEAVELVPLLAREGRERCLEYLIDEVVTIPKRGFASRCEPVPDCAARSRDAFDHFSFHKAVGERAEGLVALKRHLGECMSGRVGTRGDCAECVPLGKRCPNFSQSAVHRPVVAVLELLDGSTQVA